MALVEVKIPDKKGIQSFNRPIGFPTTLPEFEGIDRAVIVKIRMASTDPRRGNKLQNVPLALTANPVDQSVGSVLEAA
jgi:hypothetical protein